MEGLKIQGLPSELLSTNIPALYPESDVPTFLSWDFRGRIHLSSAALGKAVFIALDKT